MIRNYLFLWGGIILCAFFCCAGIQMIKQDAGVLQMESFHPDQESFRSVSVSRQADEKLMTLADNSGIAYEKLLAAFMLKNQFRLADVIRKAEVVSDVLGYERLNEELFGEIASYYKRICNCVEFLPVCDIYSSEKGINEKQLYYDAGKQVEQMTVVCQELEKGLEEKTGDWQLQIPVNEKDQGLVPVVCMKTGTVVSRDLSENTICIQLEEGIQLIYGNLKQDLGEWEEGEIIESGELLGSVSGAGGLLLKFRLRIPDGTWVGFNGSFCLFHGKKMIRSVTQMLP